VSAQRLARMALGLWMVCTVVLIAAVVALTAAVAQRDSALRRATTAVNRAIAADDLAARSTSRVQEEALGLCAAINDNRLQANAFHLLLARSLRDTAAAERANVTADTLRHRRTLAAVARRLAGDFAATVRAIKESRPLNCEQLAAHPLNYMASP